MFITTLLARRARPGAALLLGLLGCLPWLPAAPVVVSSGETWDGVANPHAAAGVVLSGSGTVSDPFTYTIPDGMELTSSATIHFSAAAHFRLAFAGNGLTMDDGAQLDLNKGGDRNTGLTFTLDLGGHDISGLGSFVTTESGVHALNIINAGDVSLKTIDLQRNDTAPGWLTIEAAGAFSIAGPIDVSDISAGGNVGGQVMIRASSIQVRDIVTGCGRTASASTNGDVYLAALGPPAFDPCDEFANVPGNEILLDGLIDTTGALVEHGGGDVLIHGVRIVLGPDFDLLQPAEGRLGLVAGLAQPPLAEADLFIDQVAGGSGLSAVHKVEWSTPTLRVLATEPADGADLAQAPESIVVHFSQSIDPGSIDAADLTVDGAPATSATLIDADSIRFDVSLPAGPRSFALAMAAGAVSSAQGAHAVEAHDGAFRVVSTPEIIAESVIDIGHLGVNLQATVSQGPNLYAYYGPTPGGLDPQAWQYRMNLGPFNDGVINATLFGLEPSTQYYCRLFGTNAVGEQWGVTTLQFTTRPDQPPTDSDTAALWLFDERDYEYTILTDKSLGRYDLRMQETGRLVAGRFGNALALTPGPDYNACYASWNGGSSIGPMFGPPGQPSGLWGPTIAPGDLLDALAAADWTCEFWLRMDAAPALDAMLIDLGHAYDPGFSLRLNAGAGGYLLRNHYQGFQAAGATDADTLTDGDWHHLAFTRRASDGAVRHFVDHVEQAAPTPAAVTPQAPPPVIIPDSLLTTDFGIFDDSRDYALFRQHRFNLALGEDRQGQLELSAAIDELRFSSIVRYGGGEDPAGTFSDGHAAVAQPASQSSGPPLLFGPDAPGGPVALGSRKHVFIDEAIIDAGSNITRTLNPPTAPTITTANLPGDYSAIDHDGAIHLIGSDGYASHDGLTMLLRSDDGVNFVAPNLGVVEYGGSTDNNYVLHLQPNFLNIFVDGNPATPADKRFKGVGWFSNRGIYLYSSPDLIHWRRNETLLAPLVSGGGAEGYWDDQRGEYRVLIKRDPNFTSLETPPPGGRVSSGTTHDRLGAAWPFQPMTFPHYAGWAVPVVTGEWPTVFDVTAAGEVYRSRATKYPWAPDVYLAFVWRFPPERKRVTELMTSRDGVNWTGTAHLGMYVDNGWELNGLNVVEAVSQIGLIRRGDQIWQYYEIGTSDHDTPGPDYQVRFTQRLDGFLSLDAGATVGTLTTRPFLFEGDRLALNLKTTGTVRVALLDEAGRPLDGLGLADCDPLQVDDTEVMVTWNGGYYVGGHAGRPVRLRFEMQHAKLFAFQFDSYRPNHVADDRWNLLR